MELETLFDDVDDFCLIFEPSFNRQILSSKQKKRIKIVRLSLSEIMTIIIYFHHSSYPQTLNIIIKIIFRFIIFKIFLIWSVIIVTNGYS